MDSSERLQTGHWLTCVNKKHGTDNPWCQDKMEQTATGGFFLVTKEGKEEFINFKFVSLCSVVDLHIKMSFLFTILGNGTFADVST